VFSCFRDSLGNMLPIPVACVVSKGERRRVARARFRCSGRRRGRHDESLGYGPRYFWGGKRVFWSAFGPGIFSTFLRMLKSWLVATTYGAYNRAVRHSPCGEVSNNVLDFRRKLNAHSTLRPILDFDLMRNFHENAHQALTSRDGGGRRSATVAAAVACGVGVGWRRRRKCD